MAADMTREELNKTIELYLDPVKVTLNDINKQLAGVFGNTGKLFDIQRDVADRLTSLEQSHRYTCISQEQSIGGINHQIDGLQKALNDIKQNQISPELVEKLKSLPDPKTMERVEKRTSSSIQTAVWITGMFVTLVTLVGIGYNMYHKLENQYNAIIRDKQEQQKQEAKRG